MNSKLVILLQIVVSSIIVINHARQTVLSYVPVVMLGYDVVAYHLNITGCNSILGKKQYSHIINSTDGNGIARLYEFWFADQNNLNIFKSDPWQYIPKFGGFCSWGTCCEKPPQWPWTATFQGPPAGPDPKMCGFRVHTDSHLYFNIWKEYDSQFFSSGVEDRIKDAEHRWIEWYGSLHAGPINHYCFSTNGHSTINDCVYKGLRYAPALNPEQEIYPIDDYIDSWPLFNLTQFPTQSPTKPPTSAPTLNPTNNPTSNPTSSPPEGIIIQPIFISTNLFLNVYILCFWITIIYRVRLRTGCIVGL